MQKLLRLTAVISLLAGASPAGCQTILTVAFQHTNLTFSAAQFAGLPHRRIHGWDPHEQKEHAYSGVPIRDLVERAGAPMGDKLRGPALRLVVLVEGSDGYGAAFALAEFDEAFGGETALLADQVDALPPPVNSGPLRLIVPGDKKAARWVRMVNRIEVRDAGGRKP